MTFAPFEYQDVGSDFLAGRRRCADMESNMIKKSYFYSDPLAAAWMADKFGMKFANLHIPLMTLYLKKLCPDTGMFLSAKDIPDADSAIGTQEYQFSPLIKEMKIYIHPDSLHILEPRMGDICSYWGQIHDFRSGTKYGEYKNSACKLLMRVILRGGAHFMWPEIDSA